MDWNVELVGIVAAVLTTVGFVPQLVKILKTKSVEGISLAMYLVLFLGLIFWLTYGFLIDSFAIKLANIVSGVLVFSLIVLKVLYNKNQK